MIGEMGSLRDADFVVRARHSEGAGAHAVQLDRALREELGGSWEAVRRLVRTGKVRVDGDVVLVPTTPVATGTRIEVRMASPRPTESLAVRGSELVHVDAYVVVVRKPAGISTVRHPSESDPSAPLDELVRALLRKGSHSGSVAPLGVVQRLDRETSGLIVFCRNVAARDALRRQFRNHSVHRRYLALVHGRVASRTFASRLVEDRGDGYRGSTTNPRLGREAVTHVRAVETFPEATLLECTLETGRTHQIRIHLSEAGHPLVGDRVYIRAFPKPLIEAPRLMLHAAELGFEHPKDGREMRFNDPMPPDMAEIVERFRRSLRG